MAPTCDAIAASLASGIRTDVSFGLAIGDARQTLAKEENDFGNLDAIPLAMLYQDPSRNGSKKNEAPV